METNDNAASWGIVELMGHRVVAGLVSKSEMLGKPLMRVDVPATSAYPEFTQFYGEAAIYCVTFVSEQVARLTAESTKLNPVSVYTPELIPADRHREVVQRLNEQIAALRRGLPAGAESNGPDWGDEDEEDEDG